MKKGIITLLISLFALFSVLPLSQASENFPEVITNHNNNKIQTICASGDYSMILMKDGTLWGWGANDRGQLGDGTTVNKPLPEIMMKDVKSFAAGGTDTFSMGIAHTLIVKNDDTLWACGSNSLGELGDGTFEDKYSPVYIMDDVKIAAASWATSAALKNDGSLWIWGDNSSGQSSNGTFKKENRPFKRMEDVKSIAAGSGQFFAIKNDDTLRGFGSNYWGMLGIAENSDMRNMLTEPVFIMSDVKKIIVGDYYVLAIKNDNTLWGWGNNQYGQLGDGTTSDKVSPEKIMDNVAMVSVGSTNVMVVKNDGTLWGWESEFGKEYVNYKFYCIPIKVMHDVKHVTCGNAQSVITKNDDSSCIWEHSYTETAQGFAAHLFSIIVGVKGASSSEKHFFLITEDNSLYQYIDVNTYINSRRGSISSSKPIKIQNDVIFVNSGGKINYVIKIDGTLFAWGDNQYGQVGNGYKDFSAIPIKINLK